MNFLRLLFVAILLTVGAPKFSHAQIVLDTDLAGIPDGSIAGVTVTGPGGAVATFVRNGNVNFVSEQVVLTSDGGRDTFQIDIDTSVAFGMFSFDIERTSVSVGIPADPDDPMDMGTPPTNTIRVQLTEGGRGVNATPVAGFADSIIGANFDAGALRVNYYFNTTATPMDYTAPDGSTRTLNAASLELFVDGTLAGGANQTGAANFTTAATSPLSTFLFQTFSAANGSVLVFDNLTVESLSGGVVLGDVDLSGDVTFLDIAPFITVLSTNGFQAEADIDGNGMVTFLDIQPFIDILAGTP